MPVDRSAVARRRLLQAALALPAGALLGGCVVAPYGPYHRPSAAHPGARYKGAWCQGAAGPPAVIELPLAPGVLLTAVAQREYPERDRPELPLRLRLQLPPAAVRFEQAGLQVNEGKAAIGSAPQISVYRYAPLPADGWIDPARVRPSGAVAAGLDHVGPHGKAILELTTGTGFVPERIGLDGLAIDQAGRRIAMPAVELMRPSSARNDSGYISAAMRDRLQARAAACRRDTPKLACDNIIEYASHSFEIEEPDAHFRGRWYRFDGRAGQSIQGDIEITLRRPERWRLLADGFAVTDAATGLRRSPEIRRFVLALNDRVPLDTPLFAGPVDGSAEAQMSIEVMLPGGTGDFEVRLPALMVGSERIDVPVMRFEKRYLDGGIEPFNC